MNPEIFREYDIRGIAGKDMDDNDVYNIGRALGSYIKRNSGKKICLARDCRTTSDNYGRIVAKALSDCGCHVSDIGITTTPMLYYSIHNLKSDGGIMITASHNPPEYNGFKVNIGTDSLHGQDLQKIRQMILQNDYESGNGSFESASITDDYYNFILKDIKLEKKLKIGVDAGNGTAGPFAVEIFKNLGCEVHDIYCDMDGTFPNHEADPTVEKNLDDLKKIVKERNLDIGIGFDGDGDRLGIIDRSGNIIYGDQMMIIFAREVLKKNPDAVFISEVKCSLTMYEDIEKNGGKAIMWKTGHSKIKKKMKETKALLAGEMSGHIFFADRYFGHDDGIYAACRMLEIIDKTEKSPAELIEDVPKTFSTPEIRMDCPEEKKPSIVSKMTEIFKKTNRVIDIDGARILYDDGWGLIRSSNTQPVLVLRFESYSEEGLARIKNEIEGELKKIISLQ
ncbi:MAG: phosphomannomutase/phosphoglucomutase [Desulfobacteraceae bacterium]|nr:phosphomannomutase/phosphoglucomutase [Desulfobacteraceae bacterium]